MNFYQLNFLHFTSFLKSPCLKNKDAQYVVEQDAILQHVVNVIVKHAVTGVMEACAMIVNRE